MPSVQEFDPNDLIILLNFSDIIVNERLDQMSVSQGNQFQQPHGVHLKGRMQQRGVRTEETYYDGRFSEEEDRESNFIHQRQRGATNREDENLDNIKMKIPAF